MQAKHLKHSQFHAPAESRKIDSQLSISKHVHTVKDTQKKLNEQVNRNEKIASLVYLNSHWPHDTIAFDNVGFYSPNKFPLIGNTRAYSLETMSLT